RVVPAAPLKLATPLAKVSVGRRLSTRSPPVGPTMAGAVAFRVEPSGPAAVPPPVTALGETGVRADSEQALARTAEARRAPAATDFKCFKYTFSSSSGHPV